MPNREKRPRGAGWWPAGPLSRHNPCPDGRENRASSTVAAEFTGETDSAAEQEGFELSVPRVRKSLFLAEGGGRRSDRDARSNKVCDVQPAHRGGDQSGGVSWSGC